MLNMSVPVPSPDPEPPVTVGSWRTIGGPVPDFTRPLKADLYRL